MQFVCQRVDIEAIELAAEGLLNNKFVQEKMRIQEYFGGVSQDTGKYCFGIDDTLRALELGAVETLIVWMNVDITRYVLHDAASGDLPIHSPFKFSRRVRNAAHVRGAFGLSHGPFFKKKPIIMLS